jgi:hypothetical protein
MMNAAITTEPDLYRSEAFAEDVLDLVATMPVIEPVSQPKRWVVSALPVALALLGAAAAVVPPRG